MSSNQQSQQFTIYGFTLDRPFAISTPPVDATPDQPLPDARPFLRVFSGTEEPNTLLLRCGREYIGVWRHVYEHGRTTQNVDEQLSLLTWLADREAGGHTKDIVFQPDAPMNPSSYGEMLAWLAWKYLLMALRQHDSAHADWDAATFLKHAKAFDQLTADVRAGRIRLPEQATDVFPPEVVTLDGGDQDETREPTRGNIPVGQGNTESTERKSRLGAGGRS